ncbi:hypothetical protein BgiBS90_005770, partial [Biomphalaria glabrata]
WDVDKRWSANSNRCRSSDHMGRTRLEEAQGRSDVQKGQGSVLTVTFLITTYGAGFWFTGSRRTGQTQCQ